MSKHVFREELNAANALKALEKPTIQHTPRTPQFIPAAFQPGIPKPAFDLETGTGLAEIAAFFNGSGGGGGANTANAREGLQQQLKFGLESIGLGREELELGREGLALNRRDAIEKAINNALQRGIFRSGIRARNVARVGERADLAEQGLDITGKRLDLSERELRARIENALAGLKSAAGSRKSARIARQRQAELDFEQSRRNAADELIASGLLFEPKGSEIVRTPGGIF